MFQYAAGLALAEKHRTIQKLDVHRFSQPNDFGNHVRYSLHPFNIVEQFSTAEETAMVRCELKSKGDRVKSRVARGLARLGIAKGSTGRPSIYRPSYRFDADFLLQRDNVYIGGEFQSELFFRTARNLVQEHFTFRLPMSLQVAKLADRIQGEPQAVAVHFRRGDYVTNAERLREISSLPDEEKTRAFSRQISMMGFTVPLPLVYYQHALRSIAERVCNPKLFIFSDDIETVRRQFSPELPHEFVFGAWQGHEAMRLMSMCRHIIVANSSFSWWAAWLNPFSEKVVIAPDPWFGGGPHDDSDVVPASWTRLKRSKSDIPT